eukprot:scaffold45584_cov63-Phaeocystis_antarctica.AAC.1
MCSRLLPHVLEAAALCAAGVLLDYLLCAYYGRRAPRLLTMRAPRRAAHCHGRRPVRRTAALHPQGRHLLGGGCGRHRAPHA